MNSIAPKNADATRGTDQVRRHPLAPNKAIYERGEVKRAGAENLGRELPHIPLAVGVGRSGPSQTTPAAIGSCTPDTHPLSPRPRESSSPRLVKHYEPMPT
jgi:hypothetical protein